MTCEALIAELRARGVHLDPAGDRLRVDAPKEVLTEDLLAELRSHKAEILEALQKPQPVKDALPGGVDDRQLSLLAMETAAMSLGEFAEAGLVAEVRSRVLDEVVLFASDDAVVDPGERRVVYRACELRELVGMRPEDLRFVHRVKKVFGGTIVPS